MTKFTAPILRRLNPGFFRYSPSKRARTGPSITLPLLFILRICCVVSRITFLSELTPIIAYHVLHFRWYMQTCIYTFILLHTYNILLQHTGGVLTFSARLKQRNSLASLSQPALLASASGASAFCWISLTTCRTVEGIAESCSSAARERGRQTTAGTGGRLWLASHTNCCVEGACTYVRNEEVTRSRNLRSLPCDRPARSSAQQGGRTAKDGASRTTKSVGPSWSVDWSIRI